MKILILGAAGQIPRYLTPMLLEQTDAEVVLLARDAERRLAATNPVRETIISGDYTDPAVLARAIQGVDVVYLNVATGDVEAVKTIISAMKDADAKKFIIASILDIYGEVTEAFSNWNKRMLGGDPSKGDRRDVADYVESSDIDYTILRLTWLYNQDGNINYEVTQKGESFPNTQVTRQAVAQLIVDIVKDTNGQFANTSLGVGEPNTYWDKPSFY